MSAVDFNALKDYDTFKAWVEPIVPENGYKKWTITITRGETHLPRPYQNDSW